MVRNWLSRLTRCLTATSSITTQVTSLSLSTEMDTFEQSLNALDDGPEALLSVLHARDRVDLAGKAARPLPVEQVQRLIKLDGKLLDRGLRMQLDDLPLWRQTLQPAKGAWWWFLDQRLKQQYKSRNLLLMLITGVVMLITATVGADVVRRLWAGALDMVSVFGTLFTVGLAVSPLVERGYEFGSWALDRVLRIKPRRAQGMCATAVLALTTVLIFRVSLPLLARYRNNQGLASLQAGNLTVAQRRFQHAVNINPNLPVPYHNVADVYRSIGRPEEAKTWYWKAIERDRNFAPAFQGLGHLYNEEGEHEQAESILTAGLKQLSQHMDDQAVPVTRYRLLSHLGWAYFAQQKHGLALDALEEALDLEAQLEDLEKSSGAQYRQSLPHYYLAQLYDRLERPLDAYEQWEACLRLLEPGWQSQAWRATTLESLEALEAKTQ